MYCGDVSEERIARDIGGKVKTGAEITNEIIVNRTKRTKQEKKGFVHFVDGVSRMVFPLCLPGACDVREGEEAAG